MTHAITMPIAIRTTAPPTQHERIMTAFESRPPADGGSATWLLAAALDDGAEPEEAAVTESACLVDAVVGVGGDRERLLLLLVGEPATVAVAVSVLLDADVVTAAVVVDAGVAALTVVWGPAVAVTVSVLVDVGVGVAVVVVVTVGVPALPVVMRRTTWL